MGLYMNKGLRFNGPKKLEFFGWDWAGSFFFVLRLLFSHGTPNHFFLIIKYRVPCSSYLPSPSLSLDHFETYRLRMGKAKSFKDEFTSGLFFFPYNLLLLRLLFSFFLLILHNQRVIWICIHYLLVYERIFLKFSSLISISLLQSKDSKNHAILLPNTQTEFP